MDQKIHEAKRAKPPLESILKLARKLNSGERLSQQRTRPIFRASARRGWRGCPATIVQLGRSVRSGKASGSAKHFRSAHKLRSPYPPAQGGEHGN
jgi:hypothetical protein